MSSTKRDLGINIIFLHFGPTVQQHPDGCFLVLTGVSGSLLVSFPHGATGQGPWLPEGSGTYLRKADI